DYKKGRYSLSNYKLTGKDNSLIIQLFKDGTFDTEYEKMKLTFHGLPFEISSVKIDNEEIPLKSISINDNNDLLIDKNFTLLHLSGKE
ncbi:MAG TPA: glycosyl hydrolase, partial [Maribacter sp.]|nr:glycosyl hydrolase [Maribacter sp.]